MNELNHKTTLYNSKNKLKDASKILDQQRGRSPILKTLYNETLNNNTNSCRDIIAKLNYVALTGDQQGILCDLILCVQYTFPLRFIQNIKNLSTVVVIDKNISPRVTDLTMIFRAHDKTWYNILRKILDLSIRINQDNIDNV